MPMRPSVLVLRCLPIGPGGYSPLDNTNRPVLLTNPSPEPTVIGEKWCGAALVQLISIKPPLVALLSAFYKLEYTRIPCWLGLHYAVTVPGEFPGTYLIIISMLQNRNAHKSRLFTIA
ncbi:hypothetical protein L1987_31047 [Smallanthus sonchifolius]|uniref:Uncharacterized protein n=1 Tax=Smallanthus sonchifolius TaxID=185202 RepID=A0ACB9I5Y1_9ASTR|nr:hypothetical protein L1987_31047 [Smallanthus sonchifolius]